MAALAKRKRAGRDPETGDFPILAMRWRSPDYAAIIRQRLENLDRIREHPEDLPALKAYYRLNPADFINDWGYTFDPRNADIGLPTLIPFVLFDKQREWIAWVMEKWQGRSPGLCEKSRDMGVSWLAMALSCTLCLFREGIAIGVGSRKGEYVDKIGTHKPLLPKARMFMENLPVEFRGGWESWRDAPFMRVSVPATGSIIAGEGGDDIGRGDRTSIYFVDEYAHFERPELTEASLSMTTNCRIDMSSVRGMNNPFARKRWEGKVDVFIFDWHDDPRKDEAWYEKQKEDLDPVVVAQEIDRDYSASVTGIVIPGAWVRSAIGALEVLGLPATGAKRLALDVADEGFDKNAVAGGTGVEISLLEEWSGKGSDIFGTVERAFEIADENGVEVIRYDADGLGAGARGDARIINERRVASGGRALRVVGFRGSEGVLDPDGVVDGTIGQAAGDKGRTNQDYFANRKAQGWWALRKRFQRTHRWVEAVLEARRTGEPVKPEAVSRPDEIVSLHPKMPLLQRLVAELSQPTYATNGAGKIVINKKPAATKSPNLADAAMIEMAEVEAAPLVVTAAALRQIQAAGSRRRR
jgi:phage terminase large subunit